MEFDSLNFLQSISREIALATMWATDYRHIFNDEQIRPFAITPGDPADLRAGLTTNITCHRYFSLSLEYRDEHQFVCRAELGDHCHVIAGKRLAADQILPFSRSAIFLTLDDLTGKNYNSPGFLDQWIR